MIVHLGSSSVQLVHTCMPAATGAAPQCHVTETAGGRHAPHPALPSPQCPLRVSPRQTSVPRPCRVSTRSDMAPPHDLDHKKLMSLVEKNPSLYDMEDGRYMDVEYKNALWEKIGAQLHTTPAMCKARWNNIRDNFRKSIIKNQFKEKPSFYKYSAHLKFLHRYFKRCDKTISALETLDDDDVNEEFSDNNEDRKDFIQEYHEPECVTQTITEDSTEMPSVVYTSAMHPVDAFLVSLASTLKQLSPRDLSQAKLELFQVAHKFEMRSLAERQKGGRDPMDDAWMQN